MENTLEKILSDASVRSIETIEESLRSELSAGGPWYDESL